MSSTPSGERERPIIVLRDPESARGWGTNGDPDHHGFCVGKGHPLEDARYSMVFHGQTYRACLPCADEQRRAFERHLGFTISGPKLFPDWPLPSLEEIRQRRSARKADDGT